MKTLVSTDTSCLINYEILKKYEISVFPLNVIIDGCEYLDGVTINQEQLCKAMREPKSIKTSTPAYGVIIDYFDELFNKGYEHIIHFTISSKLSSMFNLFSTIAEENYNGKLTIVDAYSVSSLMLSQVLYTYEEVQKGTVLELILEEIEKRKSDGAAFIIPENLNALKNGGRVSPTIAAIGNTIGIKPIIALIDGALEKDTMIKNVKKACIEKAKEYLKKYSKENYDYTIIQFDPKESTYQYVFTEMEELLGKGVVINGIVPINVCAHCGPGAIGIVVTPKINNKSLNEF